MSHNNHRVHKHFNAVNPTQDQTSQTVKVRKIKYTVKHATGVAIGIGMMFSGSLMASSHLTIISPVFWDTVSYFIHGVGCIPVIHYTAEPIWNFFLKIEEEL